MSDSYLPDLSKRDCCFLIARDRQLRSELAGGVAERFGRRRLRLRDRDRHPGVPTRPDWLVERNATEERDGEIGGEFFSSPLAEDIALVPTFGTHEVAHVLDDAQRRHIQLLIHPHGAPRVGNRNDLRSRDDDAAGDGDRLAQRERDVAGAWWHVDDQIIDILPSRAAEELLDDPVKHGAAPDYRRIIAREKRHRDQLDPVLARRNDLAAVVAR